MLIFSTKKGRLTEVIVILIWHLNLKDAISVPFGPNWSLLVPIDLVSHHDSHRKLETVVLTSFASFSYTSTSSKGKVSTTPAKKDDTSLTIIRAEQIP